MSCKLSKDTHRYNFTHTHTLAHVYVNIWLTLVSNAPHKSSFATGCIIMSIVLVAIEHLWPMLRIFVGLSVSQCVSSSPLPLSPVLCRFMRHLSCESLCLSYFACAAAASMIFHFSLFKATEPSDKLTGSECSID